MSGNIFPSSIAVLGSTGSVGKQALDVARFHNIKVDLMSAHRNVQVAEEQIRAFSPHTFVMTSEDAAKDLRLRVADTGTRVLGGEAELLSAIAQTDAPTVIHSILGKAGLAPLMACIDSGKKIGLANKETIVIAGDILLPLAKEKNACIIPVDSEHSALFQCLSAGRREDVASVFLTASGGPFFGYTVEQLKQVTLAQTLAHPTWQMGAKITVDSATLMNKGFEVIEAVRLFSLKPEQVRVVVHRESIIHSAVEYIDAAVIAQMGAPDMRLCVQYAITYPYRSAGLVKPLSLSQVGTMTFAEADTNAFPLLSTAFRAISLGGAMPAVLNAADEVAVDAFLHEKISFWRIAEVVCETIEEMAACQTCQTLSERLEADAQARIRAASKIK